ncbi:hypothetical protein V5799_008059 [Amblyomma americanum]|uniref:Alpha-N-acetylglucosaminidase C-terminal domain-containing protein n=1 Tax=Amblyomma americanum TaxID=6943 RepID=A0AAQ4FFJ3_AMBAM
MPRWELFLKFLLDSIEHHRRFNESAFSEEVFQEVERPFTFGLEKYPTEPQGDSIEISQLLYTKYKPMLF